MENDYNDIDMIFKNLQEVEARLSNTSHVRPVDDYNANTRRKIFDDVSRRKQYAESVFDGKKTHTDYITGEQLHKSAKMAKNKYGMRSYINHTYDVDHIIPLKDVHAITKYNPFLTNEDIRSAANNPLSTNMNYRVTQSKFNRSKRDSWNHTMAYESVKDGKFIEAGKLLGDEAVAFSAVGLDLTGRTVKNSAGMLLQKGYQGSKKLVSDVKSTLTSSGVEVYLVMDAIKNLYKISEGKITAQEAAEDMGEKISRFAAYGIIQGSTDRALRVLLSSSGTNLIIKPTQKYIAGISGVSGMLAVAVFDALISGDEISARSILSTAFNNTIGSFEGTIQTVALLVPIPGFAVTVTLSLMIVSACSAIYSSASLADRQMDEKLSRLSTIEKVAVHEMETQSNMLRLLIQEKYKIWDSCIEKAYDKIFCGIYDCNVDTIAVGLDYILSLLGKNVRFKNEKDFNDFFMDKSAVFKF